MLPQKFSSRETAQSLTSVDIKDFFARLGYLHTAVGTLISFSYVSQSGPAWQSQCNLVGSLWGSLDIWIDGPEVEDQNIALDRQLVMARDSVHQLRMLEQGDAELLQAAYLVLWQCMTNLLKAL